MHSVQDIVATPARAVRPEEVMRASEAYWLGKLAGDLPIAALPPDIVTGSAAAAAPAPGTADVTIVMAAATAAALQRVSGGRATLAFVPLVAALKILLHLYTDVDDVIVGTTIHIRHAETSDLNQVLALRDRVTRDDTVRAVLTSVQRTLAEAYAHQKYPFDRLVRHLRQERQDMPGGRLFAVSVLLDGINDPQHVERTPCELTARWSLPAGADARAAALQLSYDANRFEPRTIEVFGQQYCDVVAAVLAAPDLTVGELDVCPPEVRERLVVTFNATAAPDAGVSIVRAVEQHALRTPGAVAVTQAGANRDVTYAGVDAGAKRLARRLERIGVGRGAVVAIGLELSADAVIAILAVLRIGAAYMPIDPRCPAKRAAFMLADAGAAAILTGRGSIAKWDGVSVPVVCVDDDGAAGEAAGEADRAAYDAAIARHASVADAAVACTLPDDVTYIIYTSGSTGWPKGVAVSYRALSNYLAWAVQAYAPDGRADMALHTSLAVDLTVTSLFVPLLTGGRVVVYEPRGHMPAIFRVVEDDQVDVVKLTPSHLALVREHDFARSRIRCLIVGGEAFATSLAGEVQRRGGERLKIYNEYGPTEATVGCAIHRFDPETDRRLHVPIGRPIPNAQVYVLDGCRRPVADGMRGDIAIGGRGLAIGYVGRPDLTAGRFVEHPFEPGQHLYLTGDAGRHLPGGGLEYLGRRDDQVKVGGMRLQLEEVRHLLNRHPDIVDSAVRLIASTAADSGTSPGPSGDDCLVAYYVSSRELAPGALRTFLADTMARGTLPAFFVPLQSLPLSPSGKLDVRALPAPDDIAARMGRGNVRTPTEEILAGIWAQLLRATGIGIDDNFFEIGGHSLLASRIVSRIRDVFDVELPLRTFFETPTVGALAAAIDTLRCTSQPPMPTIVPVPRTGMLPLSFAQEGLWFIDRLRPGGAFYNCGSALRLYGPLDAALVARAFGEIVRRHEVLRTTFAEVDGAPVSMVAPAVPATASIAASGAASGVASVAVPVPVTDLSGLDPAARERETKRQTSAEMARPFDLAHGPLLRVRLLRLAAEEQVLLLVTHHVVSDEWSMSIIFRELSALYGAYRDGYEAPLPELPVQYADYAAWQRTHLAGGAAERQLAYWKDRLAGAPDVLALPTDHPRPAVLTHRGAQQRIEIPLGTFQVLQAMARREGVTLYMGLLAAFQTLLAKYTGSTDIVTGTWIAGRTRRELEDLAGFFVNVLVMRTDFSGDPTVREVLRRVRETTLGAFEHQDVPFERVVEVLRPERRLSHAPLLQVSFTLNDAREQQDALPGLTIGGIDVGVDSAKFDLEMNLTVTPHGLTGSLIYSTDLFEPVTAARLAGHFTTLLAGLVAHPDRPIADVSCVPEAEREALRRMGQGAALDVVADGVPGLVLDRAAAIPDAIAVIAGEEHLSYAALVERAGQLADRLHGLGVREETLVAIATNRSPDLLVALLGVMQSGGAYVPLDPHYPRERLALMLADSRARVLITQHGVLDHVVPPDAVIVFLDDERSRTGATPRLPAPSTPLSPLRAAYVIFTSGSTGRPKGTIIPHRALASSLQSMMADPGVAPGDRFLAVTTLSFDIAALELFMPLMAGATVVIADRATAQMPAVLADLLRREQITVMQATPASWQALFESGWQGDPRLRVFCGGEALAPALAARLHTSCAAATNMYGPTETTIWSSVGPLTSNAPSLGHPIANTALRVLDRDGGLAPAGVPGELGIAGESLARGYLGRPGLTAARFVPDAQGAPGARLYRTGDLVRWRAGGELEFLGRLDAQVKLRGFRIEPGEIETVLGAQPGITRCVVVRRDDAAAGARLVAYVVLETARDASDDIALDTAFDDGAWRAALAERLPDYMIPAAFVRLDALPLTPNGKVDRTALPAPRLEEASGRASTDRPRDSIETALKQSWEEVLAIGGIGIRDNFFALGGHSLAAVKLSAALSARYGKMVNVRAIFDHPTIAEQAALVRQEIALSPPGSIVAIQPRGSRPPIFCVHPGGGLVHCFVDLARHLGGDQPVYAFQSHGLEEGQSPLTSIEAMAELYIREMRNTQPRGPYRIGGLSFGAVVAFEMARRLDEAGECVSALVLMDGGCASQVEDFFTPGWEQALSDWEDDYIVAMTGSEQGIPPEEMMRLDPDTRLARYLDGAKQQDRVPRDVTADQFRRLLRVFATNTRARRAYRPAPYPGRAVLFRSAVAGDVETTLGWGGVCRAGVEVHVLPGGHGELVADPVVAEFAAHLRAVLDREGFQD